METSDRDKTFEEIKPILVIALGIDESQITMESTLAGDLGAESIDFLDILFRCEQELKFKSEQWESFASLSFLLVDLLKEREKRIDLLNQNVSQKVRTIIGMKLVKWNNHQSTYHEAVTVEDLVDWVIEMKKRTIEENRCYFPR